MTNTNEIKRLAETYKAGTRVPVAGEGMGRLDYFIERPHGIFAVVHVDTARAFGHVEIAIGEFTSLWYTGGPRVPA